jgi:hypothetical protein
MGEEKEEFGRRGAPAQIVKRPTGKSECLASPSFDSTKREDQLMPKNKEQRSK